MAVRLPALESLRYLEACVRHASFSKAADALGVTPAAVSLRIRNLEAALGKQLFHRSGPKVVATDAGTALAAGVADALRRMQAAVDECRETPDALRVTAVPSFATRWLAPRLAKFHALADAVPINLDVSSDLRSAGSFDVAVRTGLGDWAGFEATPLMAVEVTPMLSPQLASTIRLTCPADLAGLTLLPHDQWANWFRETGSETPRLRFYADDYPTHELDALAAMGGAGVALLSPNLFAPLLREGKLVQPFSHVIRGPTWHYVLLPIGHARAAARRFRAWLREEARCSPIM
jgi:LysR family glycine cleavage system transcriptional activator